MSSTVLAVRLKAPDPAASTAMGAIRSMGMQLPPVKLLRFDIWDFTLIDGGTGAAAEIVGHFTDIVNPNKHIAAYVSPGEKLPGESDELNWTGILVTDRPDSIGINWTGILKRRGFPVESVRCGVLWKLGYLADVDDSLAAGMTMDLAVSRSRGSGLFSNPVSQEVRLWE